MHPSTRQTGTVAGFDPDVHMANWEVIRRPYVLIRNEPEADTEKLAVLTDKAEDLPSYLRSTTEAMYLYIDNEQLAERIPVPLLARLPLEAGGGQLVSPGYDDFRYPNNRSRPFHSDSSTSSWINPTASSSVRPKGFHWKPAPKTATFSAHSGQLLVRLSGSVRRRDGHFVQQPAHLW